VSRPIRYEGIGTRSRRAAFRPAPTPIGHRGQGYRFRSRLAQRKTRSLSTRRNARTNREIASTKPKSISKSVRLQFSPISARARCPSARNWARRFSEQTEGFYLRHRRPYSTRSATEAYNKGLSERRAETSSNTSPEVRQSMVLSSSPSVTAREAKGRERADRSDQSAACRSSTWTTRPRRM